MGKQQFPVASWAPVRTRRGRLAVSGSCGSTSEQGGEKIPEASERICGPWRVGEGPGGERSGDTPAVRTFL